MITIILDDVKSFLNFPRCLQISYDRRGKLFYWFKEKDMDKNLITMVDRAFAMLDYLYEQGEAVGVSELARMLDIPKANAFRILKTLEKWDVVEKDSLDKFHLGRRLIKYGSKAKEEMDLIKLCQPSMAKIAKEIGETVNLGIKYEDNILTIHSEEGETSILVSKLIPISPMYCSSMGKNVLAHMTDEELSMYFTKEQVKARTINTLMTKEAFLEEKDAICTRHIAYDNEEYEYGLTCLSSPIFNAAGEIVACIGVSGPTSRLRFKGFERIEELLISITKELTSHIPD